MTLNSSFAKRAVPFMVLILGAPFVLQRFNSIRYKYRSSGMLTSDEQLRVEEVNEARKAGVSLDPRIDEMLEKIRQESDREWKNVRGPRPWENSKEMQDQQRQSGKS